MHRLLSRRKRFEDREGTRFRLSIVPMMESLVTLHLCIKLCALFSMERFNTDTNHNVKKSHFQLIIGGNVVEIIGVYLIDPGLLKVAEIRSRLWTVKDFASNLLILQRTSAATFPSVLQVHCSDPKSQNILSLTLFFMWMHLFSMNCKEKLNAKERVMMLWSSLMFLLHVDGVHIITKRNWLLECNSMVFVMMRNDVTAPHWLTSEIRAL